MSGVNLHDYSSALQASSGRNYLNCEQVDQIGGFLQCNCLHANLGHQMFQSRFVQLFPTVVFIGIILEAHDAG